jgi:hypothetical protein
LKSIEYTVLDVRVTNPSEAPKGFDIFYRCAKCGDTIPSIPSDSLGCSCDNIFIDIDYVRLDVKDFNQFQVVRMRQKK